MIHLYAPSASDCAWCQLSWTMCAGIGADICLFQQWQGWQLLNSTDKFTQCVCSGSTKGYPTTETKVSRNDICWSSRVFAKWCHVSGDSTSRNSPWCEICSPLAHWSRGKSLYRKIKGEVELITSYNHSLHAYQHNITFLLQKSNHKDCHSTVLVSQY